ncbi:MAG: hypothetical protein JJU40_06595 [Rhodobacteraceae bacterium]|nr:hypothetical protein [Paracoccaceae bacterium]
MLARGDAGRIALARTRLHEGCGPARLVLGLLAARAQMAADAAPVFWIRQGWETTAPFPPGLAPFLDPGRLVVVTPRRTEDIFWCLEEVLRSGEAGLAVAELPQPPGLTAVRRLHLAAETGATEGRLAPVGLALTPGDGGAAGVESRWHLAPLPAHGGPAWWRLERRRARTAPPASWLLRREGAAFIAHPPDAAPGHETTPPG